MERISGRQLALIGAVYTMDATLVSLPAQISAVAKQDAIFAFIPAALLILGSLWLLARVMARFPEQDLYTAMIQRFPLLGRLIALGYVLFYFFIMTRDLRMMADFISITLLPQTPLVVVASLVAVCVMGAARAGVEVLGRLTELFTIPLLIIVFLLPLMMVKDLSWDRFQPFLEYGIRGQVQGAWYAVAYVGEIVALPLIFANQTFKLRHGAIGLLLGTAVLVELALLGNGVLGYPLLERSLYPTYELVRQVRITDFLDRLDLFFVGIYFPTMMTKIGYSLYVVCRGVDRIMPTPSPGTLVAPLALLGVACAGWFFADTIQLIQLNRTWPALALLFQLLIPLLLFLIMRPKRQGSGASERLEPVTLVKSLR